MYQLRGYQEEAVQKGVDHLLNGRKPAIIVAPTGAGKSLYIANICLQLDGHTLVLQPSVELLKQNYYKLLSYDPDIDAQIYSASFNSRKIGKITFATIGSIRKVPELFQHIQYVIIDESHLFSSSDSMYKRFLDSLGGKPCIGLTATPFRLAHNSFGNVLRFITRTSPRTFHSMIHCTQIEDLEKQGYLAKAEYFSVKGFDVSKVRVNSTGSDYDENSLRAYYKEIKFDNSVVDVAKRLINVGRKNLLVFTKFVEEAEMVAKELGEIAAVVHGGLKMKDRTQILDDFKEGKLKIVVNVGVLVLGFDFPAIETILISKPSRSLAFYYQVIGRGLRPHPDKKTLWVVDMCQNIERFGHISDLWVTKDRDGKDCFIDKKRNKQLTNIYFN